MMLALDESSKWDLTKVSSGFFSMIVSKLSDLAYGRGLPLEQNFLILALLTFWTRWFFVIGSCPVHCRMFSIAVLHLIDGSSITLSVVTTKNIFRHCQLSPGRQNHPGWEPLLYITGKDRLWREQNYCHALWNGYLWIYDL